MAVVYELSNVTNENFIKILIENIPKIQLKF